MLDLGTAVVRRSVHDTSRMRRTNTNNRRASQHPSTAEIDYTEEELEFLKAMELFKKETGKRFPSFSDCLHVAESLGWEKSRWRDDREEVGMPCGDLGLLAG